MASTRALCLVATAVAAWAVAGVAAAAGRIEINHAHALAVGFGLGAFSGYADNVLAQNNGNAPGTQTNPEAGVAAGVQQIGINVCGTDTVCP